MSEVARAGPVMLTRPDWVDPRGADEQLIRRLATTGFAGPEYAAFAAELATYGLAVCEAWLVTGVMFVKGKRLGRLTEPPPVQWLAEDRRELALETVAVALRNFRQRALLQGEWDPGSGASLTTYFVGCCVLAFPNVYRRWARERRHWSRTDLDEDALLSVVDVVAGPEEVVVNRMVISDALSGVDGRTAAVLRLAAQGYGQDEIAEVLQTTARAVEAILYRHRRRSRPSL